MLTCGIGSENLGRVLSRRLTWEQFLCARLNCSDLITQTLGTHWRYLSRGGDLIPSDNPPKSLTDITSGTVFPEIFIFQLKIPTGTSKEIGAKWENIYRRRILEWGPPTTPQTTTWASVWYFLRLRLKKKKIMPEVSLPFCPWHTQDRWQLLIELTPMGVREKPAHWMVWLNQGSNRKQFYFLPAAAFRPALSGLPSPTLDHTWLIP